MSSTYSFTTTRNDNFINRISDEMDSSSNFAIVNGLDKSNGSRSLSIILRQTAVNRIADIDPNTPIGGDTFGNVAMLSRASELNSQTSNDLDKTHFTLAQYQGPFGAMDKYLETFRHQIRHASNLLEGKTVRVTVESF